MSCNDTPDWKPGATASIRRCATPVPGISFPVVINALPK